MFRLDKVIKPWKESASLNDHINLYGFWNETTFLTKSGDLGMVLDVQGVDYESLDSGEQEYAVKRMEAALKAFGPGFHVYQYLLKSNRPEIPFASYDDPVVEAAVDQRRRFFASKHDSLYQIEIFYVVLLEGARSKQGVGTAIRRLFSDPAGAIGELRAQFTNNSMKTLLRTQIEGDLARLDQRVQAFTRQLADFVQISVLDQEGQFTFLRRLVNYDAWRIAGKPQNTQFLDYQVVNSTIEAERDHLRVGDHFVRVLTMKEAITETRPLVLDSLLKISANFMVCTEWTPLPADKARKEVNKRRRHFNMSKTGFVSQLGNDTTRATREMSWSMNRSRPISRILVTACVRSVTGNHSAISPSPLCFMAIPMPRSAAKWANSSAFSQTQMAICSPRPITSSMPTSPRCRETMR
jgi:type IV secretory pathway VirB4 component